MLSGYVGCSNTRGQSYSSSRDSVGDGFILQANGYVIGAKQERKFIGALILFVAIITFSLFSNALISALTFPQSMIKSQ